MSYIEEPHTVTRDKFAETLEQELQLRGVPFSRARLLTFVADLWPLVQDDSDVNYWATEFLAGEKAGEE